MVTADDLLDLKDTPGEITLEGLPGNVEVALRYLESWLGGNGAVAIHNLMEDTATAEISRSQIWQWIRNSSMLPDGTPITATPTRRVLDEEMTKLRDEVGPDFAHRRFDLARDVFEDVALSDDFVDFATLPAYAKVASE